MIFGRPGHVRMVIRGGKTQTRRDIDRYTVGRDYSIQPGLGAPGMPQGRVEILDAWVEDRTGYLDTLISGEDARAEGCYTPREYENLYKGMHPGWETKVAYSFSFIPADPYPGTEDLLEEGCCPGDCGYLTILLTPIPARRFMDVRLQTQLDESQETEEMLNWEVKALCSNCGYIRQGPPDETDRILPEPDPEPKRWRTRDD